MRNDEFLLYSSILKYVFVFITHSTVQETHFNYKHIIKCIYHKNHIIHGSGIFYDTPPPHSYLFRQVAERAATFNRMWLMCIYPVTSPSTGKNLQTTELTQAFVIRINNLCRKHNNYSHFNYHIWQNRRP